MGAGDPESLGNKTSMELCACYLPRIPRLLLGSRTGRCRGDRAASSSRAKGESSHARLTSTGGSAPIHCQNAGPCCAWAEDECFGWLIDFSSHLLGARLLRHGMSCALKLQRSPRPRRAP